MKKVNVVAVTGASSGIGKATVQLFAQKGWQVFAGARHRDRIPQAKNITSFYLDVTKKDSNQHLLSRLNRLEDGSTF